MVLHGLKQWQVADLLQMSENYFGKCLRYEWNDETKRAVIGVINGTEADIVKVAKMVKLNRPSCARSEMKRKRVAEMRAEMAERKREKRDQAAERRADRYADNIMREVEERERAAVEDWDWRY